MVISIPKGIHTMENKKAIISKNAPLYRRSRKKKRTEILNVLVNLLKMNRKYISFLLRISGKSYTEERQLLLQT